MAEVNYGGDLALLIHELTVPGEYEHSRHHVELHLSANGSSSEISVVPGSLGKLQALHLPSTGYLHEYKILHSLHRSFKLTVKEHSTRLPPCVLHKDNLKWRI